MLLARAFPPTLTATVVWLSEMGVDLALVRFQAYRAREQILVSVSRIYPIADVEEFTVSPTRTGRKSSAAPQLPIVEWSDEDMLRLCEVVKNPTVLAALDLCSSVPGRQIPLGEIEAKAERSSPEARGDLAGLTMMVKGRFARSNWPIEVSWEGPGKRVQYSMTPEIAARWTAARDG